MSLVDGSQTAYGLQEKPHDRGRLPPGPEDNYTSGAAISSTDVCLKQALKVLKLTLTRD